MTALLIQAGLPGVSGSAILAVTYRPPLRRARFARSNVRATTMPSHIVAAMLAGLNADGGDRG